MIDMKTIQQVFTAKLTATGSLDAALQKAVWVAYKQGVLDAEPIVLSGDHDKPG
jgi:hypothetical protein